MRHHVKKHRWEHGELKVFNYAFDSLVDAITFCDQQIDKDLLKIYNDVGELIKIIEPVFDSNPETYA